VNESPQQLPPPRRGDKVATYIGRAFACCVGGGLVIFLIAFKAWRKLGVHQWLIFGAMIGLCLGYGLGGDIWGARLYGFFTGHNFQKEAEKPVHPAAQKGMLFILIGLLVFVVAVWVAVLLCMRLAKR